MLVAGCIGVIPLRRAQRIEGGFHAALRGEPGEISQAYLEGSSAPQGLTDRRPGVSPRAHTRALFGRITRQGVDALTRIGPDTLSGPMHGR